MVSTESGKTVTLSSFPIDGNCNQISDNKFDLGLSAMAAKHFLNV